MKLRSFIVRDMAEALTLVRREMGPDAIIVSSQPTRSGNLEVRAALDAAPADPIAPPDEPQDAAEGVAQMLLSRGVEAGLAENLGRAARALGEDAPAAALALALETRFRFRPVSAALDHTVILIGPAGAGKSSAAAKLAARAALNGDRTRLVCADWRRAAAVEQLDRYADATRAAFDAVADLDALASCVESAGEDEFVIVDAPAANLYDPRDVAHLTDLIDAARAEPVLVIEAGVAREEASALARRAPSPPGSTPPAPAAASWRWPSRAGWPSRSSPRRRSWAADSPPRRRFASPGSSSRSPIVANPL